MRYELWWSATCYQFIFSGGQTQSSRAILTCNYAVDSIDTFVVYMFWEKQTHNSGSNVNNIGKRKPHQANTKWTTKRKSGTGAVKDNAGEQGQGIKHLDLHDESMDMMVSVVPGVYSMI